MKNKILEWFYKNNTQFFVQRVKDLIVVPPIDLDKVFIENKEYFESLLIKDFIGNIPKEVNEPNIALMKENSEMFQRWVLWQSYYVNRKAIHDQPNLQKYDGMMIYLKVLHLIAETSKKKGVVVHKQDTTEKETPWLETALEGVTNFNEGIKKYEKNKNTKTKKS